jgi:CubicO group peptidase (beta-lactamase class C family)
MRAKPTHRSTSRPPRARVLRLLALLPLWLLLAALLVAVAGRRTPQAAPVAATESPAPGEEPVDPTRIAPAALDAAEAVVRAELERRTFPGAALALGIGDRVERLTAMGYIGWRDSAAPVSADTTLYDLASVTKAVATTTAVLLLVEDGKIGLDDPVQRHLPAFEGELKERVTWRHLLTHTSGLPVGANIRGSTPRERARRLLRTRIGLAPGQQVFYSDLGFLVLWEAATRAAGEPLPKLLERRVWRPLGMHHTRFAPGMDCTACAPTMRLSTGQLYRGRPNDLLARQIGDVTGSAGLFSTAHDLARFAAMIANGGELEGVRVLRPESVREILRQQPRAGRRTLGWVAFCPDEPPSQQQPCERPLAYGHNGWAGTSLWVEPERGVWAVLLTNRSYDVRAPENMQALRREVFRRALGYPPMPLGSERRAAE